MTTLLHQAVAENNHAKVKELVDLGAPVTVNDESGWQPLQLAAKSGNAAITKMLLDHGAKVDECGSYWDGDSTRYTERPLYLASVAGHTDVVKLLIAAGANIDKTQSDYRSPITEAAMNGHEAVVELLVKAGAKVNFEYTWESPLLQAVTIGNERIVKILIKVGANVDVGKIANEGELFGTTPLLIAAHAGYASIVKLLLEKGAEERIVGLPDGKNRMTPFEAAAIGGHTNVLTLLKKYTATEIDGAVLSKLQQAEEMSNAKARAKEVAMERKSRWKYRINGLIGGVAGYFIGGVIGLPVGFIWSITGGSFNSALELCCLVGIVTGGYMGSKGIILS
jgi:ankyrin repeat protein